MMSIVDRLRALPPRGVCEHGSQRGKCAICELAEADARIAELEAAALEPVSET